MKEKILALLKDADHVRVNAHPLTDEWSYHEGELTIEWCTSDHSQWVCCCNHVALENATAVANGFCLTDAENEVVILQIYRSLNVVNNKLYPL